LEELVGLVQLVLRETQELQVPQVHREIQGQQELKDLKALPEAQDH